MTEIPGRYVYNTVNLGKMIVETKDFKYGQSWAIADEIIKLMGATIKPIEDWQYLIPTVLIIVKVCRAIVSPWDKDHWIDIQGYAQLVVDAIEADDEEKDE